MANDAAGNGTSGALDRMTESVYAKFAVRVALPIMMAVLVPVVGTQWTDLKQSVSKLGTESSNTTTKMASMERDITTINTKLDAGLMWRLTQLERRFEAMESRADRRDADRSPSN